MSKYHSLATIAPDLLYPLPVLQRHCGFSRHAIETARRSGLVSRPAGKRVYVLGSYFIFWVVNQKSDAAKVETVQPVKPEPVSAPKILFTRSEAAEYLAIRPQTLAIWAVTGKDRR